MDSLSPRQTVLRGVNHGCQNCVFARNVGYHQRNGTFCYLGGILMNNGSLKVQCMLEGDSAIDFEKCQVLLKIPSIASGRQKQQSLTIAAALLALDAVLQRFQVEKGERYPAIDELLQYAGCRPADIDKLLGK
ncbi:hypothetical protein [Pseudomonas sp. WS 5532]|uniref:hypothetical protein n=1 Tax=Pseudomonas sp. WS 5532 TaxID=2717495 RepID=UPI0021CC88CA|nr:hypothetical protein [Pseudomonas sp. WS 5532]